MMGIWISGSPSLSQELRTILDLEVFVVSHIYRVVEEVGSGTRRITDFCWSLVSLSLGPIRKIHPVGESRVLSRLFLSLPRFARLSFGDVTGTCSSN